MSESVPISDKISKVCLKQLKLHLNDMNFKDLQLQYRGEGNENLVISMLDIKYVLRLRKSAGPVDLEKENENLKISFLYHYFITRMFFTDVFSLVPIIVEIPEGKLKWLNEFFLEKRPDDRQEKYPFYNVAEIYPDLAFLPLYRKFAKIKDLVPPAIAPESDVLKQTLAKDYVEHRNFVFSLLKNATFRDNFLSKVNISNADTLCVEIKPKQGWTAEADRLLGICPFCLHQYQKLSSEKVDCKSGYCPLDLFSGDSERMLRALKELIKCPQNNFRIIKNGSLVYGENSSHSIDRVLCAWFDDEDAERSINNFCYLITKILTHEVVDECDELIFTCDTADKHGCNLSSNINAERIEQILTMLETRCRQEVSCLPHNSVMGRILRLQKLDSAGLEAVRNYYALHSSEYESDYSYVYSLISRIESEQQERRLNVNVLEAYLLSTAAKDLSVLMSFRQIVGDQSPYEIIVRDHAERQYEVNVSVVDVGPKPISCLKKHVKRNESVLNSFIDYHCTSLAKENKS